MTTARAQPFAASELTKAHEGSPWVTMPRAPEIELLFADCWQQIWQLRKSLADLDKTNARSWGFFEQGVGSAKSQVRSTPNPSTPRFGEKEPTRLAPLPI